MIARPYQTAAIADIKKGLLSGKKRCLLQLATGGGKTFIFSTILQGAHNKGSRCIMVTRGQQLVEQASRRLTEMGVDHGVLMAGHKKYDVGKNILVASIDTCRSRDVYPEADILVIDEAHYATSQSFKDFLSHYEGKVWISVTATPWVDEGLSHLADWVVYPISMSGLIAGGYLVPAKYYIPTKFDTSQIKITAGEFNETSAIEAFEKQSVYGDIYETYQKHCVGQCTWIYAINIDHADKVHSYLESRGVRSVVITGDTPLDERLVMLEKEDLVVSVGTLTTGVDVPRLRNIILCRPTKSKNLYFQILGRGTRPYEGKDHFKVFDHVNAVSEHGFIVDEKKTDLKPLKKKKEAIATSIEVSVKACPTCYAACPTGCNACPECGHEFPKAKISVRQVDGYEMQELGNTLVDRIRYRGQKHLRKVWARGNQAGRVFHLLLDDFGEENKSIVSTVYHNELFPVFTQWKKDPSKAPCSYGKDAWFGC